MERIQKKMRTRASYEAFREKSVWFKYGEHRKIQMRERAWCEAFRKKERDSSMERIEKENESEGHETKELETRVGREQDPQ